MYDLRKNSTLLGPYDFKSSRHDQWAERVSGAGEHGVSNLRYVNLA